MVPEVDVSGGSVRYQSGVISTSLLRRGDQLIALNNAQSDVGYDQLISANQSLAVDGYLQGNDAGSMSIVGARRTYAGLSGVKAGSSLARISAVALSRAKMATRPRSSS